MSDPTPIKRPGLFRHFETRFISGLLLTVPVFITFFILRLLFGFLRNTVQPFFRLVDFDWMPDYLIGAVAVLLLIVLIYLLGLLATNVAGRKLIHLAERIVDRIPLVKSIYASARKAVEILSTSNKTNFKAVCATEFPKAGIRSIGFVTGSLVDDKGQDCFKIFIPTTPNPTTGFLIIVPCREVTVLRMAVDEAFRMIVSGGILSPERLQPRRPGEPVEPFQEEGVPAPP
jgi:uncharacterized membrane protein